MGARERYVTFIRSYLTLTILKLDLVHVRPRVSHQSWNILYSTNNVILRRQIGALQVCRSSPASLLEIF